MVEQLKSWQQRVQQGYANKELNYATSGSAFSEVLEVERAGVGWGTVADPFCWGMLVSLLLILFNSTPFSGSASLFCKMKCINEVSCVKCLFII